MATWETMSFSTDKQIGSANATDAANGTRVRIEIISEISRLMAIGPDWRDLETRVADRMAYFQSYDWCLRWCENYLGADECNEMRIAAIYRGDTLVSIWPLIRACEPLIRACEPLGLRVVRFLGEPLAQYGNVLLDTNLMSIDEAKESWGEIRKALDCDAIVFERFPKDSPLAQILDQEHIYKDQDDVSLMMELNQHESWDAYEAGLKKSTRKNRRRRRRNLEELGNVTFKVHYGGTPEYKKLVHQSIAFKLEWLNENGRRMTSFADPRAVEFLAALDGKEAAEQGAIALALYVDDKPIAIELGFGNFQHYYCYLGSFDWALKDYSPGKIQMEETLKWALSSNLEHIDFLGNYTAYQSDWSNCTAEITGYGIGNTLKGTFYARLWKPTLMPLIKTAFRALPPGIRRLLVGAK
ncbi:MAG: hypothetical protein COA52_16515 [Hyphomicrobiales bacterium]|nr:GNAT family N-acetyltransferase [Hyphomicrobiales bacterium]PCJ85101.1 MAG: hypothetical protein COA52_16515 [Hyphomicrobiales bacterium]